MIPAATNVVSIRTFGGRFLDLAVLAKLDTTRVTDAGSTRTVLIVSGVLVLVSGALIAATVWFWRNTVPDPDALESLAFFEERVVDGVEDAEAAGRQRRPQLERRTRTGQRSGGHLRLHRGTRNRDSSDLREVTESPAGDRRRRRER